MLLILDERRVIHQSHKEFGQIPLGNAKRDNCDVPMEFHVRNIE